MKLFLEFFATFIISSFAIAATCADKTNIETNTKVRSYMEKHGLIFPNEEQRYPDVELEIRWDLLKVVDAPNGCFAVMALCTKTNGIKDCAGSSAYEVVGLMLTAAGNIDQVVPFEQLQTVPKEIIAKIGFEPGSPNKDLSFYYALLSEANAVAAMKSAVTKTPYGGFSGVAIRGKKASFDPTVNRDWEIKEAKYNLRRGLTAEVLDVQAFQLDGLDESGAEGYWKGCDHPTGNTFGQCNVAPWGQAFIVELL